MTTGRSGVPDIGVPRAGVPGADIDITDSTNQYNSVRLPVEFDQKKY